MGCAHLKSGGTSSDKADRLAAAQNTAYYMDYWYNGAGTGVPDPNNKIMDNPVATDILPEDTPIILGGDWNEDEQTNGRRGPAAWLSQAEYSGSTDGTDRDRGDMSYDDSRDQFNNSRNTLGNSKLDYIAWQDSIAELRRSFVFNSQSVSSTDQLPEEVRGFPVNPRNASALAADHRSVIADFILPAGTGCCSCPGDFPSGDPPVCDGYRNATDFSIFASAYGSQLGDPEYNVCCDLAPEGNPDGYINLTDFSLLAGTYGIPCP
jgi:hypothetical protein